jgi:hypothetical protein
MAKAGKFDSTDRWMLVGSAISLTFMLILTYYVAESMREEQSRLRPQANSEQMQKADRVPTSGSASAEASSPD